MKSGYKRFSLSFIDDEPNDEILLFDLYLFPGESDKEVDYC